MITTRRHAAIAIAALPLLLPPACGRSSSEDSASNAPGPSAETPAWRLGSAPANAQNVADVKADAAEGDHVVVRGRIGGRKIPMNAESAVFVIMDPAIPSCADNPKDNCPTPWDYCCETPESITANNATVALVDQDGTPLRIDLRTQGISPLDEVIVVGSVDPRPSPDVLTIRATAIHRVGG